MDEQEFLNQFTEYLGPTIAHLGKEPGMREIVQRYFEKLDIEIKEKNYLAIKKNMKFLEMKHLRIHMERDL